jgi:hypothetical protein
MPRVKQERYTWGDTISIQKNMIAFITGKINGIHHFINKREQYDFYEMVSRCLLSQGPFTGIKPILRINGKVVQMGVDVHHFANMMAFNMNEDVLTLKTGHEKFTVEAVVLWKLLLKYCLELFPRAQAEALSKSKEIPKMPEKTLGYQFDSGKKLEE